MGVHHHVDVVGLHARRPQRLRGAAPRRAGSSKARNGSTSTTVPAVRITVADEPTRRAQSSVTKSGCSQGDRWRTAVVASSGRQDQLEARVVDPRDLDVTDRPGGHAGSLRLGRPERPDRFRPMCGRYVSATPPDQIAAYFGAEAPEALLRAVVQRGAHQGRLRGALRRRHPPRRRLPLGARAALGQGRQDRLADDQRAGRDPRREERLQVRLQAPPLPHPGRRVLRVAEERRGSEEGQEAALLHPPARRRALRLRRAVGGVARPRQGPGAAALLHDHHHHAQRARWPRSTTACR